MNELLDLAKAMASITETNFGCKVEFECNDITFQLTLLWPGTPTVQFQGDCLDLPSLMGVIQECADGMSKQVVKIREGNSDER